MDDSLIDSSELDLARKSRLPGTGFFVPSSIAGERADDEAASALDGAETVIVADDDADGLACAALLHAAAGADEPFAGGATALRADDVVLLPASPYSIAAALNRVGTHAPDGVDVRICDLCPDAIGDIDDELATVTDRAASVRWFDHHQWTDAVAAHVRDAGVELVVGESDEECSADVTARSVDYEFDLHLRELVAVTRDHDLWIREDDRSDDLADYARWADHEEYLRVVGQHGPDLPEDVLAFVADRRVEKAALVDLAVDRSTVHEIGPWTVGVTYGRCSQNEVAERLRADGADAAVIVKPAGSASIRGTDAFERCHEVAQLVNGGGHPRAAGCKPDIYDDMLDYAHHWTTEGATAKRVIRRGFERIAAAESTPDAVAADGDPDSDA